MQVKLDIYIEPGCANCDQAYEIAERVRQHLPKVDVSLIDISQPGADPPDSVFAVPTYLLNGETWSLGNPDKGKLMDRLREMAAQ